MTLSGWFASLDSSIIVAGSGVLGAVLVRLVDKYIVSKNERIHEAERIRSEQRDQIESLRKELTAAYAEADEWRSKYWAEIESSTQRFAEAAGERGDIETELNHLKYKLREQGIDVDSDEYKSPGDSSTPSSDT